MTAPGATSPGPDSVSGPKASAGAGEATARRAPLDTADASGDWTDQVTELIVESVDKVRARTTGPVLNVAHASVYGLVAAIVAIPVLVAMLAGLVRFLDWLVPGDVWVAYLIIAVIMWIPGAILWSKRAQVDDPSH